jgi:hypothetical protein
MKRVLFFGLVLAGLTVYLSARSPEVLFEKKTIDLGISETCAVGDFNGDGKPDIFSGEAWYENPSWKRHEVRKLDEYGTYLSSLTDLALDVDGDGKVDVVSSGWHAKKIWWSRNPGKAGAMWEDRPIDSGFQVEFAFLVDFDNDGKARELLPQFGGKGPTVWYDYAGGNWKKHVVSPENYGHGIGAGDVNGDKRTDLITPKGWFEAPPNPRDGDWKFHPEFDLGHTGFIYAADINEDGLVDLVTGLAHDYGVFWMEQKPDHKWVKHVIDQSWSQPHAMTWADINGDGRKDLVTGKRFMAHDGKDPGEKEPLGIYWYEYKKAADGSVVWSKHIVDYGSRAGGGMHIPVVDMDGDGDMDFAVGGKSGVFLFENLTKRHK